MEIRLVKKPIVNYPFKIQKDYELHVCYYNGSCLNALLAEINVNKINTKQY